MEYQQLEFFGDYSDCRQLRDGAPPQQRYLRMAQGAPPTHLPNKSGALDQPTACRFTKELCNNSQPATQQQKAVRLEQVHRRESTFRSVEQARAASVEQKQRYQKARCARLLEQQVGK